MKQYAYLFILALVLSILCGCASVPKPGFPDQSLDDEELIRRLEKVFPKGEDISDYYDETKTPISERRSKRDRIISGYITLIDLQYNRFIQRITLNKQTMDTAADIIELGVDLSIPLSSSKGAKDILGAISAGISGSRLSIDKNFFFEKAVPVLISEMNAQRKNACIPLLSGINQSVGQYPLEQAIVDLNNYYFAGTFVGALQSIQAQAGKTEKDASEKIDEVTEARFSAVDRDLRDRISNWLSADEENVKKLEAWLLQRVPPVTYLGAIWVNDKKTSRRALEAAIEYFKIPE